jgi:hypothetical protein
MFSKKFNALLISNIANRYMEKETLKRCLYRFKFMLNLSQKIDVRFFKINGKLIDGKATKSLQTNSLMILAQHISKLKL